jgi:nitroimidazol reductase NimA-like FMN-containing flavoprotein (pyridoxamine 5'-phosphate oxidase superfamily)
MDTLTEAEARQFLEEVPVAHFAVISDGEPYVTPMSFVLDGDRILFRTKPGRRLSAIQDNPVVSLEASSYDEQTGDWTSVIVKGTAREVEDSETIQRTLELLFDKYRKALGSPLGRGGIQPLASFPRVIEVTIDEISGRASGGLFGARTRPGRL